MWIENRRRMMAAVSLLLAAVAAHAAESPAKGGISELERLAIDFTVT